MIAFQLQNPFPNGFNPDKDQERADEVLAQFQQAYDAITAGKACIRYLDGDRKGSIARVKFSDQFKSHDRPEIGYRSPYFRNDNNTREIKRDRFYCTATWDGRRNKVQVTIPNSYEPVEILLNYDGPTVWEKFDAKAAKAEVLKNPDQEDIRGNVLSVGDRVLYINARYGSRMTLDEGKVTEFLVSANSKGHSVTTVIENDSGEVSSLSYPESMVYKL